MIIPVATCSHVISTAVMQRARASLYKQGAPGRIQHPKTLDMLCKAPPECRLAAILQVVCCSCCSSKLSSFSLICFTCTQQHRSGLGCHSHLPSDHSCTAGPAHLLDPGSCRCMQRHLPGLQLPQLAGDVLKLLPKLHILLGKHSFCVDVLPLHAVAVMTSAIEDAGYTLADDSDLGCAGPRQQHWHVHL